ncbi:AMP-binding protein [Sorangium sp. So ce381]|uniref:AMP-binding protein n=1 Tax=Sorangium sp. So ce381 TaxID=3133307 RepID=UPI003F5B2B74
MPIDLAALLRSVELRREDETTDPGPLSATWEDPAAFRRALFAFAAERTGTLRSRAGTAYDVYADAVLRHAASDRIAFVEVPSRGAPGRLRFSELHARASALAAAWTPLGVKPGAAIAIVLPPGVAGVVALAAALYAGACVSWITPKGDLALAAAMDALAPAHVVLDPKAPAKVGEKLAKKALPIAAPPRAPAVGPHAYAPKEPCLGALSPLRAPFGTATLVPAETVVSSALSDAMLVHRLAPGERLSAPGFHHEQAFLPMVLSAWLAGAAYVSVPLATFQSTPAVLDAEGVNVLGLSASATAALRASPRAWPGSLKALFRDVGEPLDWMETRAAVAGNNLGKLPLSNLLIDTAAGGTVLFSARRPQGINAKALPSPGVPWDLFDPATKKPTAGDAGLFVRRGDKPDKDGYFLLARVASEYLWGSTLTPRRSARVFPGEALSLAVSELPFCEGAAVVPLPGAAARGDTRFVLCVFLGARQSEPSFTDAIDKLVRERLGPDYTPDAVELFPLYGRGKGKKVDPEWCASNYRAGRLHARSANPGVAALVELRRRLTSPPPRGETGG